MPALEMMCKLYSCWKSKEASWVTTNSDDMTEILLSLICSEDCINEDENHDDKWAVLVLLVNKDVLQRIPLSSKSAYEEKITFIAGESCMMVMSVPNYKWRVEIEGNNYLVEMLDTVKAMGLERLEIMCLDRWQKDLTLTLIMEWLNDTEYNNIIEEMKMKPRDHVKNENDIELLELVQTLLNAWFHSDLQDKDNGKINDDTDDLNISKDLLDGD